MLRVIFTLFQDEGDHSARDECQPDGQHEGEIERVSCGFSLLVDVKDWEGFSCHREGEIWVVRRGLQDRLVHELRESCGHILRSRVDI